MTLDELFGRYALSIDRPEDYIKWGEMQLLEGNDSMNAAILAGLDSPKPIDSEEVYSYFRKCLKELGIEWPDQKNALIEYSRILSEKIISNEILPKKGLEKLSRLYSASDYSVSIYSIWDELEEDISMVGTEYGPIFNTGLTKDNVNDFIFKQAEQYLNLLKTDIPDNFFKLAYCNSCKKISETGYKRISKPWMPEKIYRLLFKRGPAHILICGNCGSVKILGMNTIDGRQLYLTMIDANNRVQGTADSRRP